MSSRGDLSYKSTSICSLVLKLVFKILVMLSFFHISSMRRSVIALMSFCVSSTLSFDLILIISDNTHFVEYTIYVASISFGEIFPI